jgi:hypothetical protein
MEKAVAAAPPAIMNLRRERRCDLRSWFCLGVFIKLNPGVESQEAP